MNEQIKSITWKMVGISLGIYLGAMIGLIIILSLVAILAGGSTWQNQLDLAVSWQVWSAILTGLALIFVIFALARLPMVWHWFIGHFPEVILILSVIIIVSATKGSQPFGAIVAGFFWDISLLGVGVAIFAIAISLLGLRQIYTATPANQLRQLEATLNANKKKLEQLEKLESEIGDRIAALKTKVDTLYGPTNQ